MDRPDSPYLVDVIRDGLAHFGVKGMRWGVRRPEGSRVGGEGRGGEKIVVTQVPGSRLKSTGGKGRTASDDAVRAAVSKQKAKKSGVRALTNAELQHLVNRMNLEKQYKNLQGDSAFKKGVQVSRELLNAGKLGKEIFDTVKKATGK